MKRRRAPGAGRKPQGDFSGKTATLTTRITPDLRKGLEREAKRNGRSLSQEIEALLRRAIQQPKDQQGARHNRALGFAIAQIAEGVELGTGERWRQNPWTFQALQCAVSIVLGGLAPDGPATVPELVEMMAPNLDRLVKRDDRMSPEAGSRARTPDGLGTSTALGWLQQLRITEKPPIGHDRHQHYAEGFYTLPDIRRDLDLD
jgi:hypothetical protein